MSNLHLRSTSSDLIERLYRKTTVLAGVFRPLAQRALCMLSGPIHAVRTALRRVLSPMRGR